MRWCGTLRNHSIGRNRNASHKFRRVNWIQNTRFVTMFPIKRKCIYLVIVKTEKHLFFCILRQKWILEKLCGGGTFLHINFEAPQNESFGHRRHFRYLGMTFIESNFEHCSLRRSKFNKWRFAGSHFNICTTKWPYIGGRSVASKSLVNYLWRHVLQRASKCLRDRIDTYPKATDWTISLLSHIRWSFQWINVPANRLLVPKSEIFNTPL